MNKRQRALLVESLIVLGVTVVAVIALINLKDWTNRREALRAMVNISQQIQEYRRTNGSIPPQDYIDSIKESVPGRVRLGKLEYRAQSIRRNSPDNAILAYTQQSYRSLLIDSGYVVLNLNGQVSWMSPDQFQSAFTHTENLGGINTNEAPGDLR
jgi:type II secretory pathway pseudopilin PulG